MKRPEDYSHLKHYFFHFNSPYEWGVGMGKETGEKLFAEFDKILELSKFEVIKKSTPESMSGCPRAWEGENYLYCHPMNISGYLTEEKFEKVKEVIENFESNLFSVRSIEEHPVHPYGVKDIQRNVKKYEELVA